MRARREQTALHDRHKIAVVITKPDRAGAQMLVRSLLSGLRQDFRFYLITGSEGFLTGEARSLGVEVIVAPSLVRNIHPMKDWKAYKEIKHFLNDIQPSIVHTHSSKAGVIGRLAANKLSIPVMHTIHGWPFSPGIPFPHRIIGYITEYWLARLTDLIIVVSTYDLSLGHRARISGKSGLHLIMNAISCPSELGRSATPRPSTHKFITVTRLSRQKNLYCLIDAYALLDFNFEATIIGSGKLAGKLHDYIACKHLKGRVHLAGEKTEILRELSAHDIFVLSSDWEGLPFALIEAACAGLPIVSTNTGGVPDIVIDGINGLLVNKKDAPALAAALTTVANDDQLRRQMADNSTKIYNQNFTPENMLLLYKNNYYSLLHKILTR